MKIKKRGLASNWSDNYLQNKGILYSLLWTGSLVKKVLFIFIPFFLIATLVLLLDHEDALYIIGAHDFLSDYTNNFTLFYIFIFIYFVHGLYLPFFYNEVNSIQSNDGNSIQSEKNKLSKYGALIVSLFIGIFFSCKFIVGGINASDDGWYSRLNTAQYIYYTILTCYTWCTSIHLFLTILIECHTLYNGLPGEDLDIYHIDNRCGLKGLYNSLSAAMGFGIYFLIAVSVIIYSDYNAKSKFGIELLAYKWQVPIIIIALLLASLYYSVIIVTFLKLHETLKSNIKKHLEKPHNNQDVGYFDPNKISSSFITANDVVVFILSVLIPAIAAIMQIVAPFE